MICSEREVRMSKVVDIRTIQQAQMDLLLEVDRICTQLEIPYFLVGGSLIGAIRHNGFIPWDDDIDIAMLRENFDKFEACVDKVVDADYEYFNWYRDLMSPHPFGKLKIKGTVYKKKEAINTKLNSEIFLDIFPFDVVPNSKRKQKQQEIKVLLIRKILQLKLGWKIEEGKSIKKRAAYFCLKMLGNLKSLNKWKVTLDKELKRYNKEKGIYRVNMCGAYSYEREKILEEYAENLIRWDFEGYKIPIPAHYKEYLTNVYGDYMKLPPVSERGSKHKIIESSLGKYKIRCKIK